MTNTTVLVPLFCAGFNWPNRGSVTFVLANCPK